MDRRIYITLERKKTEKKRKKESAWDHASVDPSYLSQARLHGACTTERLSFSSHFLAFFAAYHSYHQTFLSWNPLPGTSHSCLHILSFIPISLFKKKNLPRKDAVCASMQQVARNLSWSSTLGMQWDWQWLYNRSNLSKCSKHHPVRSWAEVCVLIIKILGLKDLFVFCQKVGMVTIFSMIHDTQTNFI